MEEIKLKNIELVSNETDSAQDSQMLNYFCVGWPTIYPVLSEVVKQIKSPVWRWAASLGLSIINQIHSQVCAI